MRYFAAIAILLINSFASLLFAAEHKSSDGVFLVNFSSAWKVKKSLDPEVVLRLERGNSFFEFSKLESELSDYYLKARVKEQVESLRSKGSYISGDIGKISIHGASSFYYTDYDAMGSTVYIGFFTYNNASFAVSAKGLFLGSVKSIIYTVRKPGEKIIIAKSKPKPKIRRRKPKSSDVSVVTGVFRDEDVYEANKKKLDKIIAEMGKSTGVVKSSIPVVAVKKVSSPLKAVKPIPVVKKKIVKVVKPLFNRKPLPIVVWIVLVLTWIGGLFVAKARSKNIVNPRIPPPPKDVPPDFFFPFLVNRFSTLKDIRYNAITRQKQVLGAYFNNEHEFLFFLAAYGLLAMHIAWSLTAIIISPSAFTNVFLKLPFGSFFASLPEIFLLIPLFMGMSAYFNKEQKLEVSDALGNTIIEVKKCETYARLRDGKGKEVATLVKRGSLFKREWDFVDTDNQVVFTIKDMYFDIFVLRKLFGQLGGILRSRYSIFVENRLAGFVLVDTTSPDRFQVHLDYAFSRLAHPAQILGAALYILSKERDPSYPSIF